MENVRHLLLPPHIRKTKPVVCYVRLQLTVPPVRHFQFAYTDLSSFHETCIAEEMIEDRPPRGY